MSIFLAQMAELFK